MNLDLERHRSKAAIDNQLRPRDKAARLIGGEKKRRPNKLFRLAEAVHGRVVHDLPHALFGQDLAILLCREETWH